MPTQWQFRIFGEPAGEWRADKTEAEQDAIDSGLGERDALYGRFFITIPGELVSRHVPAQPEER